MSEKIGVSLGKSDAIMLSFCDRFPNSPQFSALFREGMSIVEQTAHYLDGQGREEARHLTPPASFAYSTESMKLTTRLMQLASWLILRRAVANGEVTPEDVRNHKRRVRIMPQSSIRAPGYEGLPETLKYLIEESDRLHSRVLRLDRMMEGVPTPQPAANPPVVNQMERIRLAFPV